MEIVKEYNELLEAFMAQTSMSIEIDEEFTHIPLKKRLKDYHGDYKVTEWDTGAPVGREVF